MHYYNYGSRLMEIVLCQILKGPRNEDCIWA